MRNLKKRLGLFNLRRTIWDHWHNKYISYGEAFRRWVQNRHLKYEILNTNSVKKFKTSDTLFVLGSGPSLNQIGPSQCDEIRKHDSFGISLSFLKEELVPTFHHLALESDRELRNEFISIFQKRRELYRNTVFFFNNKVLTRLGHPRLTPEFFPVDARCCFYSLPQPIHLDALRPFQDSDFDESLIYRGTISVILSLAVDLGYKKIVLLGVDLQTTGHFFDGIAEVKKYCDGVYANYETKRLGKGFESMTPKGDKFQPFDVYLYALRDYLIRKRGIELFVGFSNNMLCPKFPAYFQPSYEYAN